MNLIVKEPVEMPKSQFEVVGHFYHGDVDVYTDSVKLFTYGPELIQFLITLYKASEIDYMHTEHYAFQDDPEFFPVSFNREDIQTMRLMNGARLVGVSEAHERDFDNPEYEDVEIGYEDGFWPLDSTLLEYGDERRASYNGHDIFYYDSEGVKYEVEVTDIYGDFE